LHGAFSRVVALGLRVETRYPAAGMKGKFHDPAAPDPLLSEPSSEPE